MPYNSPSISCRICDRHSERDSFKSDMTGGGLYLRPEGATLYEYFNA